MAFSVNFNGIDLSTIVDGFTAITRNIGSGWTNNVQANPLVGADFISNSINSKSITVNFIVNVQKDRFTSVRKALASALNVTEPTPLTFDDDPDKVWLAVPDGTPTLDEASFYQATGSITFLVPSGIALSSYTQTLNADNSGGGNGTITVNDDKTVDVLVNNQGTMPAFLSAKFSHNSDNAYIGMAGENGVFAVGSQEQYLTNSVTTETTKVESQWLLNTSGISQSTNFGGHFMTANDVANPQNGQLLTAGNLVWKKDGLRLQDGGPAPSSGTTYMAQGAMQQWTIPADSVGDVGSANFTSTFNIWGQATKMGQTGILQVLFVGDSNQLLCGMGIYKDDKIGNSFQTQLYIGGNHQRNWKTFGPGLQELNNGGHGDGRVPNPNRYFNSTTGYFTIQKKGPVFNFTFGNRGGNYPITIPELAYTKCKKVFIYEGQLKGRDVAGQYITNLSFRSFNFQKNDVTKTIDSTTDATKYIPANNHHFGNHEVVVIDLSSSKIFRREGATIANNEMITGSEGFSIPPGKSIVTCSFGGTATTPDIEFTWKERYL